jgi:hypothetical protein
MSGSGSSQKVPDPQYLLLALHGAASNISGVAVRVESKIFAKKAREKLQNNKTFRENRYKSFREIEN